jgi:hypothetical protein
MLQIVAGTPILARMKTALRPASAALAAVLAATLCLPAVAGRPLATEDADTLDAGDCEWESFAGRETARGLPSARAWATQVGCGVGHHAQVALGVGQTRSAGDTVPGWALSGKLGLVPRGEGATGVSLAWGLGAEKAPGASMKHETSLLALVATRELSDGVLGHLNLGWARSESARRSSTLWNAAIEGTVGRGVDLMAEVYGDDRDKPWVATGIRWTLGESFSVDASYSVQTGSPRVKLWTLGFNLAF